MIRLASLLGLIALAVLVALCLRTDGATAIAFSFVGLPALAASLALYGLRRLVVHRTLVPSDQRSPGTRKEPRVRTILPSFASLILLTATAAGAADGAAVYKERCASCHGETGQSDTTAGKTLKVPPLKGDADVAAMSDADLETRIKENEKHKSFIAKLGADDVTAVATFVKNLASGK